MNSVYEKKEGCCGCSACEHICPASAITMMPDNEGFLYPVINPEICTDCGLCKTVCAFQNGFDMSGLLEKPDVYGVKHVSDEVKINSSSGGAFTGVSDYVLNNDGWVCGAGFDDELNVIHYLAENSLQRDGQRGSKYVQSNLLNVFPEIKALLKVGKKVMFSGTPCQVAGLRNYLEMSNTSMDSLYLCDFVCHGTPSPRIWRDFLGFLEERRKKVVKRYSFRSKVNGWPKHIEEALYYGDAKDHESREIQVSRTLFYSHVTLRPACHSCRYANLCRPSDITMADFHGIDRINNAFYDSKGVSLILVNTAKGRELFDKTKDDFYVYSSNSDECAQRNLQTPTPISPNRDAFWRDYYDHGFEFVAKKYAGYNLKSYAKNKIKSALNKLGLLKLLRR